MKLIGNFSIVNFISQNHNIARKWSVAPFEYYLCHSFCAIDISGTFEDFCFTKMGITLRSYFSKVLKKFTLISTVSSRDRNGAVFFKVEHCEPV